MPAIPVPVTEGADHTLYAARHGGWLAAVGEGLEDAAVGRIKLEVRTVVRAKFGLP